jgi:membrane protein YqaA with SNARE-associated domain
LKKLFYFIVKYKLWLVSLLKPLGVWGLGCLALIDSAAIPIPFDLIIAGYIWADKSHFYIYVLVAAAGSALGGLVPFLLGRAGGELFLMKRIDRVKYESLRDRFERQEFLAMMIPSMLPPPTPWKLFVFGAGVFEMKLANFIFAVFTGRCLRFLVTALLTIEYGPQIVKFLADMATLHSRILLVSSLILVGLVFAWILIKRRSKNGHREKSEERQARD